MKSKLIIKIAIITIVLLVSTINSTAATRPNPIRISLNGIYLTFTDPPVSRQGRMLVPLRTTAEALGLRVSWANNTITLIDKDRVITLTPGSTRARIGDREITLDVSSEIIRGRTFVPLRFIAEATGATVEWRAQQRTVAVTTNRQVNITAPAREPLVSDLVSRYGNRLYVGMTRESLVQIMGQPVFAGVTLTGSTSNVFRNSNNQVMVASIIGNRIVSIYTNQSNWGLGGVFPDASMEEVHFKFNFQEIINIGEPDQESRPKLVKISQNKEEIDNTPTMFIDNILVTFFKDVQRDNLRSIQIGNTTYFVRIIPVRNYWTGGLPQRLPLPSNITAEQAALNSETVMLFHVNSLRARADVAQLETYARLADVSRAHSIDMTTNMFIAHSSPSTGAPSDRVRNAGISFMLLGENLTYYSIDPVTASTRLYYSPGHRRNLLEAEFTHIGIGASTYHFTQKFIRE